jgi:hypothetical protein
VIKKIERPDWIKLWAKPGDYCNTYDEWFDKHVKPINDELDKAVVVYNDIRGPEKGHQKYWTRYKDDKTLREQSYKALLINIEPIKQETCADVLRAIIHDSEKMGDYVLTPQEIDRAKAAIDREKTR